MSSIWSCQPSHDLSLVYTATVLVPRARHVAMACCYGMLLWHECEAIIVVQCHTYAPT